MDIFSFGMCALEMAALEIQGNGDSGSLVTEENITRTIESLEDPQQKDFIYRLVIILIFNTIFKNKYNLYIIVQGA